MRDGESSWFDLAIRPGIVRRGLIYAVVVGSILITINHRDALMHGDLTTERRFKMGLTVMVPYMVSTLSAVGSLRAQASK